MSQDLRRIGLVGLAVGLGGLLGFLAARVVLVGSAASLVPWAVGGLGLGLLAGSARRAAVLGAAYGFTLAYVFMVSGYDGSAALRTRLVPFLVFGVVGAVCGTGLALAGRGLRRLRTRGPAEASDER